MRADVRPRRILMTADCVGGVWSYATDLARALKDRGIEVTLAVMGPTPRADRRALAADVGVEVVEAPFRLEWMDRPWDDVDRAGEWLLSLADRLDPDVVHLNGFCHAALPWDAPVIVVGHSCVRTWWRGVHGESPAAEWDVYTERVTEGVRAAAMLISPTRALLDGLEAEYGPAACTRVIANGSRAASAPPPPLCTKQPLVFSAGRLWDEAKNISSVCAAAGGVSWQTSVAGHTDGPFGKFCASGAARLLGDLSATEIADWYRRASIYALPARYEPFGLSVLEAAAAGCALVLGDIRSLRENWSGAATFVPADNRRALVRAIDELVRDPGLLASMSALARERAERFTVDRMADDYLDAYNGLFAPAVAA